MSDKDEYYRIALPMELKDSIEKFIEENKELGYKSIPEFVKEIIRNKLSDFEDKLLVKRVIELEKERNKLIEQVNKLMSQ